VGFKPFLTPATFAKSILFRFPVGESPKKWLKTQEMLTFPLSIHRGLSLLCNWCARFPPVAGKGGPTVNAFSWFWIGDVESKKQWWYQAISWHYLFLFYIYVITKLGLKALGGERERVWYMQLNQLIWTNHELVRFFGYTCSELKVSWPQMKKFDGGNVPLGECESQRTLQFEAGLPVLRRVSGLADPAVGYSVPCICLF
jgi:hypothetical protein